VVTGRQRPIPQSTLNYQGLALTGRYQSRQCLEQKTHLLIQYLKCFKGPMGFNGRIQIFNSRCQWPAGQKLCRQFIRGQTADVGELGTNQPGVSVERLRLERVKVILNAASYTNVDGARNAGRQSRGHKRKLMAAVATWPQSPSKRVCCWCTYPPPPFF